MKILLGCDVDPILPQQLEQPPQTDIWKCLENVEELVRTMGRELPPITWLIRSDESVKFCTGSFASGYLTKQELWQFLVANGHELGWHVHLTSYESRLKCFGFDPDPVWLSSAYEALAAYFNVRATRTGWDYGSNILFQRLDSLGIVIDFSALPGNIVWQWVGPDKLQIDWSRCPITPYHPATEDYQRPGSLRLLELPITQFVNSTAGVAKRSVWRLRNNCYSLSGLKYKTKTLTEEWGSLPISHSPIWAFYFHPDALYGGGIENFCHNIKLLRSMPDVEFITASAAYDSVSM